MFLSIKKISAGQSNNPLTIVSGQHITWFYDTDIDNNSNYADYKNGIIIKCGASLTIQGDPYTRKTVSFNQNTYIYVCKGGRLFIDRTNLQPNDPINGSWGGVIIEGQSNAPGSTTPNYQQIKSSDNGYFSCSHAQILKAKIGILIKGSGIAVCFRTNFTSNGSSTAADSGCAIYIRDYVSRTYPNKNMTKFIECIFEDDISSGPFIRLKEIRGIQIAGCLFIGNYDGTGIYSENSSFNAERAEKILMEDGSFYGIQGIGCAPPIGDKCWFENLDQGIVVNNTPGQISCKATLRSNYFYEVHTAISLTNDYNTLVYRNGAQIPDNLYAPNFYISNNSTNFSFYEDTAYFNAGSCASGSGSDYWISITCPQNGNIKNCKFEDDANCQERIPIGLFLNLTKNNPNTKIDCNIFNGFLQGILFDGTNTMNTVGSSNKSSFNRFQNMRNLSLDINNSTGLYFDYWYCPSDQDQPNLRNVTYVTLQTTINTNQCPLLSECNIWERIPYFYLTPPNFNKTAITNIPVIKLNGIQQFMTMFETDSNDVFYVQDSITGDMPVINTPFDKVKVNLSLSDSNQKINISLSSDIANYDNYTITILDSNNNIKYNQIYSNTDSNITIQRSSIGYAGNYHCIISSDSLVDTNINFSILNNVSVNLSPNPSAGNINLSLSSDIQYCNNYTVTIIDNENNNKFTHNYSNTDNYITIDRSNIGNAGTYNCDVTIDNVHDTNIMFQLIDTLTVSVYPNPSIGDINISLTGTNNYPNYSIIIYDQNDNIVFNNTYNSNINQILIYRSSINNGLAGIYLTTVIQNNTIVNYTFVLLEVY